MWWPGCSIPSLHFFFVKCNSVDSPLGILWPYYREEIWSKTRHRNLGHPEHYSYPEGGEHAKPFGHVICHFLLSVALLRFWVSFDKQIMVVVKVLWGDPREKLCQVIHDTPLSCLVIGSRGLGKLKRLYQAARKLFLWLVGNWAYCLR